MINELVIDGVIFISAKDAAARAGITHDYLTRWCREGRIQACRLAGAIWFVSASSLEDYLDQREAQKEKWRSALRERQRTEYAAHADHAALT